MKLTQEQIDIIKSKGNIKINAVAGSGKTTTIIEYAKTRPKNSRILYLAFNKSVKLEAEKKFRVKKLSNVQVETAHSLAFSHIVMGSLYKIKNEYKTNEIAELLGLQGNGEKHAEYIVANHINKFIAYFCNSDKKNIKDLNYLDIVTETKAQNFVRKFYPYIEKQTRLLLAKMDKGEIDIIHDFYLKKFQLSNPILPYDYILFDEGQDASPAMLDIFLKQKAIKVIVGDTHQQIYGWRFAVNSLEKVDYKTYFLSTSFRFGQDIANLAMRILHWKTHISDYKPMIIKGAGEQKPLKVEDKRKVGKVSKTKAVLARTNLGLLLLAIEYVTEKKKVNQIYFEGNISSYTYADEGASLYDVMNLYYDKHHLIRDKMIASMKDIDELKDYIEKTEDVQLGMMLEIVKKYGDEIPDIIKAIKDKHVNKDEKEKAEIVFSTIHRCKGMEYDAIHLAEDFITEKKIKAAEDKEDEMSDSSVSWLNEEINLLYVAVTRAKSQIHIPASLMPESFPASPQIHLINIPPAKEVVAEMKSTVNTKKDTLKAYSPWTAEEDMELTQMFCNGINPNTISNHFNRTRGAISARIKKLELKDIYG